MFVNSPRRWRGFVLGISIVITIVFSLVPPVSAHTGFEYSAPSDGERVDGSVSEISLTFSGDAAPVGDGFVVLDPDGTVRVPDDVVSADNLTWILRFDEPLAGGDVGVRWSVAAPDAHPIDGSFSFVVVASALPSTSVPPVADSPRTFPASTEVLNESGENAAGSVNEEAASGEADASQPTLAETASDAVELEGFLESTREKAAGSSALAYAARILRMVGTVGAIGGIVFAAFVLRGNRREIRAVLDLVRLSGILIMAGAVVVVVAQLGSVAGSWSGLVSPSAIVDVLWSSLGIAIALRFLAGALIYSGVELSTRHAFGAPDAVVRAKHLVGVGTVGGTNGLPVHSVAADGSHAGPFVHHGDKAWHASKGPGAFVGLALLVSSFLFDGHTVSEGPRWLHAVANLVHVATAATWAGGVIMLAFVIAWRRRCEVDTRALQLGVRFSVVAVVALVAAAVAGVALTVVILDSVSELWTTAWGRLLMLKVVLVSIAAAGGGYNHRVIVPELEEAPNDLDLVNRFRTVVTVEAMVLVAVTVVTAILIAASST